MGGLRPTGPPVGADGHRVGGPRGGGDPNALDGVRTGGHEPAEHGEKGPDARMGAGVLVHVEAVGHQPSVAVAAEGSGELEAPPVGDPEHRLAPGLHPGHRAIHVSCGEGHHQVLGVAAVLTAEAAAHLGGDNPDGGGVDAAGRG